MTITTVIFDMDGVLVDSEEYWLQARVEFAGALGKNWTMDDQRLAMGRNTIEWAHVMQERLQLEGQMTLEAIMADVKGRVIAKLEQRLPTLPGALEAVHTSAANFRVALASGSPTEVIETVMRLTRLDAIFETMVFGDTIARGKPAPDIYLEAARRLGVQPSECVGIEDSGNGLRSLKAAGMKAIAVPSPGFPLSADLIALADVQLGSLLEFSPEVVHRLA